MLLEPGKNILDLNLMNIWGIFSSIGCFGYWAFLAYTEQGQRANAGEREREREEADRAKPSGFIFIFPSENTQTKLSKSPAGAFFSVPVPQQWRKMGKKMGKIQVEEKEMGKNAEKNTQKAPFPIEQLFLLFSLQKEKAASPHSVNGTTFISNAIQFHPINKIKPFFKHFPNHCLHHLDALPIN
jgi:hypothetical protein